MLIGDNYNVWKESIIFSLGCMDLDLALHVDEPPVPTESSAPNDKLDYEWWERSNRLSLMFIKSHINKNIRGSIPECNKVKDLMKAIEEQFIRSDKAWASILMKRFSSKTFDYSKNLCEHIMEMRDMVAQLKSLKVDISVIPSPFHTEFSSLYLTTHIKING